MRILTYHDISTPDQFRTQIGYLAKRYSFIGVEEIHCILLSEDRYNADHGNYCAITFDDGYPSVYEHAFPILQQFDIPATLFVISELVGTDQPFWWDEIPYYAPKSWSAAEKNRKVWEVKEWKNTERVAYIEQLKQQSDLPRLHRQQLNWEQLAELQEAGWTIANHTHSHPLLNRCERAEIVTEVERCSDALTAAGANGSQYFAYPNGNSSPRTEEVLVKAGVQLAFLFDHQTTDLSTTHPLRISRLSMDSEASVFKTWLIASGLHSKYMKVRRAVGI